jgi:hypothetical protein
VSAKCIVLGCPNHRGEGRFVGDLCAPCFAFVALGEGTHSQAYENARAVERREALEVVQRVSERLEEVCGVMREGLTSPRPAAWGETGQAAPRRAVGGGDERE